MSRLIEILLRANLLAASTVLVIFIGLLAYGANNAALSSLLAIILVSLLCIAVLGGDASVLGRTLATNWLTCLSGLGFMLWSYGTTTPYLTNLLGEDWGHPVARHLGQGPAPISLSPFRTIEGIVAFLPPASAFLIGALSAPDRSARDWGGRWIVVFGIPYCLIGMALFFGFQAAHGGRLDVGVSSANAAATLFGMIAIVAVALIVRGAGGRLGGAGAIELPAALRGAAMLVNTPISIMAFILAMVGMLLTASRGGLIATGLALVVLFVTLLAARFRSNALRQGALFFPILITIALVGFFVARGGGAVMDRFAYASTDAEARSVLSSAHWQVFRERPLTGHGLNTFHELNSLAGTPDNWRALEQVGAVHNIFVQMLEETGLIGAAFFALMLAPPIVRAIYRIAMGKSGAEWAAAALALVTLCFVHGAVDFGLQVPAIAALFALSLGLFVGGPSHPKAGRSSTARSAGPATMPTRPMQ
jgi:O-antigen ligase